jgi:hypothetical protein
MSTTSSFQTKPDYFSSEEECIKAERQKTNTNPRYKHFKQTHFTAGDIDQFEQYRDATNGQVCIPKISLKNNIFRNIEPYESIKWEKYINVNATSVINTFNYIFDKFKKGIFIKIKEGKLRVFLPFSKKNFVNEWSRKIQIDPKYGDIVGFLRHIHMLEGRKFFPNSINKFVDSWYSNNCLVRSEFPINEGDTNVPNTSDMFKTLCEERQIVDAEFFINRRDFPILKTNDTEAYHHMYDTNNMKLLSHSYDKYIPILSMVGSKDFADIPIPTGDDWSRVMRDEGKYFSKTCNRSFKIDIVPWNEKRPIAVFRGGSTGCGVTINTNVRLKAAYLSSLQPVDEKGEILLDLGITNWNLRPRKLKGEKYLQTIDIKSLPFGLAKYMSPQEQNQYKYLLNLDGHVSAYRLSLELTTGSCVLLPASKYKLWYRDMLKPYVHYVPVNEDLSNLVDIVKWCKKNDNKCQEIAKNAQEFAKKYLTKNGILDYLQKLIYEMKKVNGIYLYNSISVIDLQYDLEYQIVQENTYYPKTTKKITDISLIPTQSRSYSLLKGIEWIFNMVKKNGKFDDIIELQSEIFNNNLSKITKYKFAGYDIVKKSTKDIIRRKEIIHESFITTMVTNELLKQIPNFVYVFGMYEEDKEDKKEINMILEHIQGQTLNDYIHSNEFNIYDFLFIILQISLALHISQKNCCFVHYDLTPWNIILQKLPEPVVFDYIINVTQVYRITTQIVPVIIDMGRSHVIYKDRHHGAINMFQTSTIQDIITLLTTTIYEITSINNIPRDVVKKLVLLANFISGTEYRQKRFMETGKDGLGDLRYFFRKTKKYTELINSKKYDLEKKTPLDFINYILNNFQYNFPINITNELIFHMNKGNSHQVFDYTLCSTPKDRSLTFAMVFHRIKKCKLPTPDNLFLLYYTVQSMEENMTSVYNIMLSFLTRSGIDKEKYVKKYTKTMKYLEKNYIPLLKSGKETPIEYKLPDLPFLHYNFNTFLFPEKIISLLGKITHDNLPSDPSTYKEIIETILLRKNSKFVISNEASKYYINNFKDLLNTNSIKIKMNIANAVTLFNLSIELYSRDKLALQEKMKKEDGDCNEAKKYLDLYDRIV